MTITIKQEVEKEIEIGEFPLYRFDVCHYYKILSLKDCVQVMITKYDGYTSIRVIENEGIVSTAILEGQEITENQFIDALTRSFHLVQKEVYPEQQLTTAEQDIAA